MPLSEDEQRILDQIEESFGAGQPGDGDAIVAAGRQGAPRTAGKKALGCVIGGAALLVWWVLGAPEFVGLAGFGLVAISAFLAYRGIRQTAGAARESVERLISQRAVRDTARGGERQGPAGRA